MSLPNLPPFVLQEVAKANVLSFQPTTLTMANGSAPGNILLAFAIVEGGTSGQTISDAAGNTWTPLFSNIAFSGGGFAWVVSIWRAVSNGFSAGNVVTFSLPSRLSGSNICVMELKTQYSGILTASSFYASTNLPSLTTSDGNVLAVPLQNGQTFTNIMMFMISVLPPSPFETGTAIGYIAANGFTASLQNQAQVIDAQANGMQVWPGITPSISPCVPLDQSGQLSYGAYISDLQLFIGPTTALYKTQVPTSQVNAVETYTEGRASIVLDFNQGDGLYARDLGCVLEWPTSGGLEIYVFQPTIIPEPEGIYDRATDWDNGGTDGAKFVQGAMVEAFSFGNSKTFFLQDSDTLTLHPLNECPVAFSKQQIKAFSCTPFIAHSCRLISTDGVEWKIFKSQLVFQPWPEATENWQTELTSLGMTGWGHAREINLAYISTSQITLSLTFDAWPTINLTVPSSGGVQSKLKITLPANKFKLIGFQASSPSPFRVFEDDIEVKIRQWGSTGTYTVLKPFGGKSAAGALV